MYSGWDHLCQETTITVTVQGNMPMRSLDKLQTSIDNGVWIMTKPEVRGGS